MSAETEWPEGVTARYLTVGGATVDVTPHSDDKAAQAMCGGCNQYDTTEWEAGRWGSGADFAESDARKWAQAHAESCRAMPKPGGAR